MIIILSLAFIGLTAYHDNALKEEAMAEAYLKKIWIASDWTEGVYRDIAFCFVEMADGKCEGELVRYDLFPFKREGKVFAGTLYNNAAECRFIDFYKRTGTVTFTFVNENEIEVIMIYDDGEVIQSRTFRPYNIKDLEYFILQEEQTVQVDLEFWGSVYFVAGIDTGSNKPRPRAYLVNENYDILHQFESAFYRSGEEIYDAVFEDVNGDGLTDVTVFTHFVDMDGVVKEEMPYVSWLFLQSNNGIFDLETECFHQEEGQETGLSAEDKGVEVAGAKAWRRYPYINPVDGNVGFVTSHKNENPENSVPEELTEELLTALQNNTLRTMWQKYPQSMTSDGEIEVTYYTYVSNGNYIWGTPFLDY